MPQRIPDGHYNATLALYPTSRYALYVINTVDVPLADFELLDIRYISNSLLSP